MKGLEDIGRMINTMRALECSKVEILDDFGNDENYKLRMKLTCDDVIIDCKIETTGKVILKEEKKVD